MHRIAQAAARTSNGNFAVEWIGPGKKALASVCGLCPVSYRMRERAAFMSGTFGSDVIVPFVAAAIWSIILEQYADES